MMSSANAWRIAVRLLGLVLTLLGAVIVAVPDLVAPLFGRGVLDDASRLYARAIGLRDLGVGFWFIIGGGRSIPLTTLFLATAAVIPLGDLVLTWAAAGGFSFSLLPHAVSLAALAVLAAWGRALER